MRATSNEAFDNPTRRAIMRFLLIRADMLATSNDMMSEHLYALSRKIFEPKKNRAICQNYLSPREWRSALFNKSLLLMSIAASR